ncbi:ATP-dependent DNA ligase [Candidatus Dojkabacteria bacterium]|uniref:DNA ligase (ATP) n=1 Tax=Candidatus Dojkabacteria bacterium TaxID=2099670 RepID=A0A3M0YZJ5_9BACT|nr:MAG: ATP-dependent DNA ligase [Candidatus Dojkabacteria bacterium]
MKIKDFMEILAKIESLSSRNEVTKFLAAQFDKINKDSIDPFFYLIQGRLAPKFVDIEYNFSEKLILTSLSSFYMDFDLSKLLSSIGDLGDLVLYLKMERDPKMVDASEQVTDEDSILLLWLRLKALAEISGKGSQDFKAKNFLEIISSVSPTAAKYITRIILGDLRLGISEKTVLDALGYFMTNNKALKDEINYAFGVCSDLSFLAKLLFDLKLKNLNVSEIKSFLRNISPTVGLPVAPKLVEREVSPEAVWRRMPNCIVQPKLDGLRGQIHYDGNHGFIFSRNQENLTSQFPEIVEALGELNVSTIILDSEIVSYDYDNHKLGTYHETMQRRRKYDIELFSHQIPVSAMCFDVLYLNGRNLMNLSVVERINILRDLLSKMPNNFPIKLLETQQVTSIDNLSDFYFSCVSQGLEGIIAKAEDSIYEPGLRNFQWIKLKYNSLEKMVDTLDLIVMGFYSGSGARTKFGLGALLCGVIGEDEKIYSVAKVGSGFTQELMTELYSLLIELKMPYPDKSYVFDKSTKPDFWVRQKLIVEVDADEITRSPIYLAGKGIPTMLSNDDFSKGLSLRFPRIKRIRFDKSNPTTVSELINMYIARKNRERV